MSDSYHILTSSVIYYWTDARQRNLFVLENKERTTEKAFSFQNLSTQLESRPMPTNTKLAFWRNLLSIQNEAISLVDMRSEAWWLVKENHTTQCQTGLERRFWWKENLQQKQNWTVKSTNLKQNVGNVKSVFEYCRTWKIRSENLRLRSTLEAIRVEFSMKGPLVTAKICVFCGWWFSNQFDIVSETPYSCDTVGCEL